MDKETALKSCSGYYNMGHEGYHLTGYYGFAAAQVLVQTGEYEYYRVDCWGYILRKKLEVK